MVMTLSMWPPRRRPNKTGSRTVPPPFLDESQWKLIADLFPHPPSPPKEAAQECLPGPVWKVSYGCSKRVLVGKIYQSDTPVLQRAGDDCRSGRRPESGWPPGVGCSASWTTSGRLIGKRRWATARFRQEKKGRRDRQHQERQGHQDHAARRRQRHAALGVHHLREPRGGKHHRDARRRPRAETQTETDALRSRSGRRLGPRANGCARDRVDLPTPPRP